MSVARVRSEERAALCAGNVRDFALPPAVRETATSTPMWARLAVIAAVLQPALPHDVETALLRAYSDPPGRSARRSGALRTEEDHSRADEDDRGAGGVPTVGPPALDDPKPDERCGDLDPAVGRVGAPGEGGG
jgi:hypothetical protein